MSDVEKELVNHRDATPMETIDTLRQEIEVANQNSANTQQNVIVLNRVVYKILERIKNIERKISDVQCDLGSCRRI